MTIVLPAMKKFNAYSSLRLILCLNSVFFLLQILFAVFNHRGFLNESLIVSKSFTLPLSIWPSIIFCLFAQVIVYFILSLGLWLISLNLIKRFNLTIKTSDYLILTLWLASVFIILFANQLLYPLSQFADFSQALVPDLLAKILLSAAIITLSIAACYSILIGIIKLWKNKKLFIGTVFFIIIAIIYSYYHAYQCRQLRQYRNPAARPNIILIGIDSLRPDYTQLLGDKNAKLMPHINHFMQQATNFAQAYTPIARTYPSWISMLTGLEPLSTGARYNLIDVQHVNTQQSLAKRLQALGYETIYATDDKRYSNIDQSVGFDKIVGPKIGVDDFILGALNDFPMSNLLINSRLGPYFFPYNAGNRQSLVSYKPHMFDQMVKHSLIPVQQRPLFLIVHFCLPHFPYAWSVPLKYPIPPKTSAQARYLYRKALSAADQQVGALLVTLKKQGRLQQAMVVMLSDHGEAIGEGDRLTKMKNYQANPNHRQSVLEQFEKKFYAKNQQPLESTKALSIGHPDPVSVSYGHGTDVLSLQQSHCLLSFRQYPAQKFPAMQIIDGPVSMLDIKPSLEAFLHLRLSQHQGQSLWPIINHQQSTLVKMPALYFETGFTPAGLQSLNPENKESLENSIRYFRIDPKNNRVIMKEQVGKLIMTHKAYAIMHHGWLFALVPRVTQSPLSVIVNLHNKQWSDRLQSSFMKRSPALALWQQLRQHFGDEIMKPPSLKH